MEWTYEMRREMQEIIPGLWLGPYGAARDKDKLQQAGMTHVLIVRSKLESRLLPKFPELLTYEIVDLPEGPTENIILYFRQCTAFIHRSLSAGGRILVHWFSLAHSYLTVCSNAGLSRSAAVCVAFLMEMHGMGHLAAIQTVSAKRCCIHIREALFNQLREYEALLQNRAATQHWVADDTRAASKRTKPEPMEDDDQLVASDDTVEDLAGGDDMMS